MAPKQRNYLAAGDASYLTSGPSVVLAPGSVAPPPPPPRVVIDVDLRRPQAQLFIEMMKDETPSYQEYKRKAEADLEASKSTKPSRFNKIPATPAPKQPPPVRICPLLASAQERFERHQMSEQDSLFEQIAETVTKQDYEAILATVPADPWIRTNDSSSSSSSSSSTGTRC